MKHIRPSTSTSKRILAFVLVLTMFLLVLPALGEDDEGVGAYPFFIEGTADQFGVQDSRLMFPDCLLVDVVAPYTTGEPKPAYNTQSGFEDFFEYLAEAEVVQYTELDDSYLEKRYVYIGIRLYLQSLQDTSVTAIMSFEPVDYENFPSIGSKSDVDVEITLYKNKGTPNAEQETHVLRLRSSDVFEMGSYYSHENYEPTELRNAVAIEYHEITDPSTPAMLDPDPPTLHDSETIRSIAEILAQAEEMPQRIAARDILHLRFVLSNGHIWNVFLQEADGWNQGQSGSNALYARMGARCYKVDREAMFSILRESGCPDAMFC